MDYQKKIEIKNDLAFIKSRIKVIKYGIIVR